MTPKESFLKSLLKPEPRAEGIHVSDLIYDCLRKQHYSWKHGEYSDLQGAITMAVGRHLHKILDFGDKELKVSAFGVVGSVDGFDPAAGTLVDLKTCTKTPRSPNDHHVRQVEYYAALLGEMGHIVNQAFILYLSLGEDKEVEQFQVKMRKPLEIIEELKERAEKVKHFRDSDCLPPRVTGWLCGYCSFASRCFLED